jgi:protein-disulfide isomerase
MTARQRKARQSSRRGVSTTQILIVVGTAVLAVAVLVALNINRLQLATATKVKYPVGVTAGGQPYKGSPDAPLKIVVFADFACSHCADFAQSLDALAPVYIETGKMQVIFRNFAFLTPESEPAAQAVECALDQGADKFWAYHDLLFSMQGRGGAALSNTSLKAYAGQLNLDTAAFDKCLDSGAKAAAVKADHDDGVSSGVTGTPTWFINGELMPGALPENELRQVFDLTLAKGSGQ